MTARATLVPLLALAATIGLLASAVPATAAPRAAMPSDFNGDGDRDLAIGAATESVGTEVAAGAVSVLYGTPRGLTEVGDQRWTQDSQDVKGTSEGCHPRSCYYDEGDRFGDALASADFDSDGYADLAIGVPYDRVGTTREAGAVNVLYGSRDGLTSRGNQRWSLGNLPGAPVYYGEFGYGLAAGDVDGDGYADLAIAARGDDVRDVPHAGSARLLLGGPRGLTADAAATLTRDMTGQENLSYQLFGAAVAVGDIDHDGHADVAVANPDDHCTSSECHSNGGEVAVFYGDTNGPGVTRIERWTQDSPGIVDQAEPEDRLGGPLVIGDFNADGFGDLAARAGGEIVTDCGPYCIGSGAVLTIYGSAHGLTAEGNQLWHEDVPRVPGVAEPGGNFGQVLAAGDFDADGADELVVGSPWKGTRPDRPGEVLVLRGVPGMGLTSAGASRWTQATPGMPGKRIAYHAFGYALGVADYGKSGYEDLAIGVPGDNPARVIILFGRSHGLSTDGAQSWSEATPGVKGTAERGDSFGSSLAP